MVSEEALIVTETCGVTVIGGGVLHPGALSIAREVAPVLVAADGAAARALEAGWEPVAVIGDMDSLDEQTRSAIPAERLHHIAEQDSTDFDKCLRNISAPFVLGIGFTGARLDHELAAFSTVARHPELPCILIAEQDICCLAPRMLGLRLPVGTRLSLFPLGNVRGRSSGLRWPLDGVEFAPDRRVGTSNETSAPEVELHFSAGNMLLILPREYLPELLGAVSHRGGN